MVGCDDIPDLACWNGGSELVQNLVTDSLNAFDGSYRVIVPHWSSHDEPKVSQSVVHVVKLVLEHTKGRLHAS